MYDIGKNAVTAKRKYIVRADSYTSGNDPHSKEVASLRSLESLTDCFTIKHLNKKGQR